jgi:hypothetical protein
MYLIELFGRADAMARRRYVVGVLLLLASAAAATVDAKPAPEVPFEVNVSADPTYGGSEPWVAASPLQPGLLVETYNASDPVYGGRQAPDPTRVVDTQHPTTAYAPVGMCGYAVSTDHGTTWGGKGTLPINDPVHPICGDNDVTVGPDGVFYGAGLALGSCLYCTVELRATTSHDGGRSWGIPGQLLPYTAAFDSTQTVQNFLDGNIGQVSAPDREYFSVDNRKNWVYLHTVYGADPKPDPSSPTGYGQPQGKRWWINVTTDQARSWARPYPMDTAEFPSTSRVLAAASNGVVAVSYTIASVDGQPCTCGMFKIIQYDPAAGSWTTQEEHVTPFIGGLVAADETSPGTFAVTTNTGTELLTYATRDYGRTWSGPTAVVTLLPDGSDQIIQPWTIFAPQGKILGTAWRILHSDGSIDIYTALSRDRGAHFSAPIRMNTATSPPTGLGRLNALDEGGTAGRGLGPDLDDTIAIWLDANYINVSWADARSGVTDAWYGRLRYTR